ncbi:PKD domain-containing protein [Panacibacter ginsenosidivorans]|uniref:PKD domain-containing protein n=1 Tax=Panacibacter ginsenosidivorans TaxID=1813871 RepID=A0A5B8VCQ2_9BACT|nr:PKD domain-containing protein [Panacibacter ginsenosidivorans]QEC68721.1 PKD domain-containing protein [Panacibacter ginsenosidivorans]
MKIQPFLFVTVVLLASCKKNSSDLITKNKDIAAFAITEQCSSVLPAQSAFVDSSLQFINLSHLQDSSEQSYRPKDTYLWDFGDQNGSTEKEPTHKYAKPGVYTVKLYSYLEDHLSDSSTQRLHVVLGNREFRLSVDTYGVDMEEANNNSYLVLYRKNYGANPYTYGFMLVDSLFNSKWNYDIAGDDNTVRLSSMKRIDGNAFILSGNYTPGSTQEFCLSKIDASGKLIWNKYLNNLPGLNTYTTTVSDGGFLTLGTSYTPALKPLATIVKCDGNGNEIWRKQLDSFAVLNNIVETTDGYAFAATTSNFSQNTYLCKMDLQGNITNMVLFNFGYYHVYQPPFIIYNSNEFLVPTSEYFYYFKNDLSLDFKVKMLLSSGKGGFTAGNNFYVYSSPESAVGKFSFDGVEEWQLKIDDVIYTSCYSTLLNVDRYCQKAIYTSNNEIIALSYGRNIDDEFSLYLMKIDPDGTMQ